MTITLLKKSRPRFWVYLFGPYLLGITAATLAFRIPLSLESFLFGVYFTFPANLLIYGVNDISDTDTDQFNTKKEGYELRSTAKDHRTLMRYIILFNVPVLLLIPFLSPLTVTALLTFFFFGIFYSAPPIRAKVVPLLDSFFNILYVFPGIIGYSLYTNTWPRLSIIIAATAWCMAMHAYSAIPDIGADTKAGLRTIATWLGQKKTLVFCATLYICASAILYTRVTLFTLPVACVYLGLMIMSWKKTGDSLFRVYTWFPFINTLVGAYLFLLLLAYIKTN